jgi:hypothetical protein
MIYIVGQFSVDIYIVLQNEKIKKWDYSLFGDDFSVLGAVYADGLTHTITCSVNQTA